MSVLPYPTYRNSEIAWIGAIPSGWIVKPLKRAASLRTDRAPERRFAVALENIEAWSGRFIETETTFEGEGVAFDAGDILFGKLRPYLAKAWVANQAGEAIGDFHVLRCGTGHHPEFVQRLVLTREMISLIDGSTFGAKMPRADWDFMGSLPIPVPPPDEQSAIASFLDRETGKIYALVTEQERLIALLNEKRLAIISQAVTKGLNPDAPMKSSGVEWLGNVPAHWDVYALKHLVCMKSGEQITSEEIEEVGPFCVFGGNGLRGYTTAYTHEGHHVLIGRQGALCGNINYADGQFWASEHAIVVTPRVFCAVRWLGELLRTMNLGQYSMTAAQPGLSVDAVGNLMIAVPPAAEQGVIATFVAREIAEVEALTAEAARAIALLRERRAALISAAVTGKIDVSDHLPATADLATAA